MSEKEKLSIGLISSGGEETEQYKSLLQGHNVVVAFQLSPAGILPEHIANDQLHVWLLDIDEDDWTDALDDLLDQSSVPVFFHERGTLSKQSHPRFWMKKQVERLYGIAGLTYQSDDSNRSATTTNTAPTSEKIEPDSSLDSGKHQIETEDSINRLEEATDNLSSALSALAKEELEKAESVIDPIESIADEMSIDESELVFDDETGIDDTELAVSLDQDNDADNTDLELSSMDDDLSIDWDESTVENQGDSETASESLPEALTVDSTNDENSPVQMNTSTESDWVEEESINEVSIKEGSIKEQDDRQPYGVSESAHAFDQPLGMDELSDNVADDDFSLPEVEESSPSQNEQLDILSDWQDEPNLELDLSMPEGQMSQDSEAAIEPSNDRESLLQDDETLPDIPELEDGMELSAAPDDSFTAFETHDDLSMDLDDELEGTDASETSTEKMDIDESVSRIPPQLPDLPAEDVTENLDESVNSDASTDVIASDVEDEEEEWDVPLLDDTAVDMQFEEVADTENVEQHPVPEQRIWILGASLGGPAAVKRFLQSLPTSLDCAFVLAQHIDENFLPVLCNILDTQTPFRAKIVEQKCDVESGYIYIAPIKGKLMVNQDGSIEPTSDAWTPPYSPCIDDVITSVATIYQHSCGVIIFSGMGEDGREGIQSIKHLGSRVWAQSPGTCANSSMPDAIIENQFADYIGGPEELAKKLSEHLAHQKTESLVKNG